jgi:hypothetical protein
VDDAYGVVVEVVGGRFRRRGRGGGQVTCSASWCRWWVGDAFGVVVVMCRLRLLFACEGGVSSGVFSGG